MEHLSGENKSSNIHIAFIHISMYNLIENILLICFGSTVPIKNTVIIEKKTEEEKMK